MSMRNKNALMGLLIGGMLAGAGDQNVPDWKPQKASTKRKSTLKKARPEKKKGQE